MTNQQAVAMPILRYGGFWIRAVAMTGRFLAKIISGLILLVGFLMVASTERKRGLHDMLAGTVVITAD